ncbi:RING-H2 finger protein ATL80-like protein [Tanacetum coccineum]
MSSTTTQPPPPPGEGLPTSLYILAAALCVLGFITLVYLYFTRWFAHAPPMQKQQHGSIATLNKQILDTLPKVTWSASESEVATECAICLSDYEEAGEIRVLRMCQHVYQVTCIDTWFDSLSSCPTCRWGLTVEEDVAS